MANDSDGKITDQELERLRERIDEPIETPQPHITEINADAIRNWAHGIGCDNPLYLDEEYATKGPYGERVAPPTNLLPTIRNRSSGLPGVHAMYAGDEWEWHRPVRCGTPVRTTTTLTEIVEHETDFGGRSVQQIFTTEFFNRATDDRLATRDWWLFRTERDTSRERDKYSDEGIDLADWDEEDIERFADQYRNEEPRGAETRYFEDVSEGDELDTLLKGPLSVTSVIAFIKGWGGIYSKAHKLLFEMFDDLPALMTWNEQGVPEPPERVHWDPEYARKVGVPDAYDYGPERVAWLGHVAHHWMGDEGFLKELYAEVRRHNLVGDVTWCSGKVTDKRVEGDEHLVDVNLEGRNQRDKISAKGSAVIRLPSRDVGDGPEHWFDG